MSLLPVVVILAQFVPQLSDEPQLVWAAYGAGVSQGLTATWFWQGLERMHLVGALELVGRAAATVGVFALVRGQDDAAFVLWLQAAGGLLAAVVGYGLAVARFAPLRTPRWRDVTGGLRLGWSMFAFRSAVSLYTAGNTFILGLFVPASQVGYYAGAERITRTLQGLLGPISQTLYPRVSHLIHQSQREAAHLVLSAMRLVLAGSLVIYAVTLAGAPTWVNLFLGREFMPAISVLRVLAAVVPLVALSHVLGIQWMLPRGLDRDFNRIIASAGALNVVLAVALAPRYGPLGMAAAVVTSEVFVAAAMYVYLRLGHLDPRSALSRHGVPS